jgi:putative transposase
LTYRGVNALAETTIGLFKTELIHPRGPWRGVDDVELATLEWVDWFNHRRLHSACHDLPPVDYEKITQGLTALNETQQPAGLTNQ